MRLKGAQGFTLLELLMVVIIIAILASIALPQYLRTAERARASEALQILGVIRSAELRYRAANSANVFTAVLTELDTDVPGSGGIPASTLWSPYAIPALGYATATRLAGAYVGNLVGINVLNGNTCASNAVYGLPVVATGQCP